MSEQTNIEWCHHTFNPWSGCSKVSVGCANCYAAALPPAMRRGAEWGEQGTRIPASDAYWREPFRWHAKAIAAGEMRRAFVGSTMDIGEDRPELVPLRDRALAMVALTQPIRLRNGRIAGLNHLWLTKRPEVLARYFADPDLYERVLDAAEFFRWRIPRLSHTPISNPRDLAAWYPHLWVGTSVEDQRAADERVPHLLRVPARVRFLSCEPLLGHVNISAGLYAQPPDGEPDEPAEAGGMWRGPARLGAAGLQLCIVGGESGRHARPMHPDWARSLRDQCVAAGVPFFFKQIGEWGFSETYRRADGAFDVPDGTRAYYPNRIAEAERRPTHLRVGKRAAGRLLDGRTWDEFPKESP